MAAVAPLFTDVCLIVGLFVFLIVVGVWLREGQLREAKRLGLPPPFSVRQERYHARDSVDLP